MKIKFKVLVIIMLTVACAPAFAAQVKLKDVPDSHWAASAVYDLVKLGVTRGYPDGTFRGNKQITRYETAIFLSKLAKSIGAANVREDIQALKDDVAALKKEKAGFSVSGSYLGSWKFGNLLAEKGSIRGGIASYRLRLATSGDLNEATSYKINLDTMDYGFMNDGTYISGDLSTQLLDIETNLKLDLSALGFDKPVYLKVIQGPGDKRHTADPTGIFPSEKDITYLRPYPAIMLSTSLWGMDFSGGYISRQQPTNGKIQYSDIRAGAGINFEGVPLLNALRIETTAIYLSEGICSSENRDVRATVSLSSLISEKVNVSGTVGLGGNGRENMMVAAELKLKDVMDSGTMAAIRASKVGSTYIDSQFQAAEWNFAGYDTFNRPLINGSVNIGGEIIQRVSEDIKLVGKGDIRLSSEMQYAAPNGRFTAEGGISYALAPNTSLDAMYRIFQDKATGDTTDVAALGLMYSF